MAEQEIAKHGKKLIRIMANNEDGFSHKLREMALEIFTIVFAVTLSIWLHGLSEHHHKQQQVKTFLLGVKSDLTRDISKLDNITAYLKQADANFAHLAHLDPKQAPSGSFEEAYQFARSNYFFIPEASRYEGFKSSGKLGDIEDEAVLNKLLALHENRYPEIKYSEHGWSAAHDKLQEYLEQELDYPDETAQRYRLIVAPKGKRLLARAVAQKQLYDRYQAYADVAAEIIKAIDKAYPDAANVPGPNAKS